MRSRAVAGAALSLGLSGCTLQALAIGDGLFQSLVAFALIALTRSTASRLVGGCVPPQADRRSDRSRHRLRPCG